MSPTNRDKKKQVVNKTKTFLEILVLPKSEYDMNLKHFMIKRHEFIEFVLV